MWPWADQDFPLFFFSPIFFIHFGIDIVVVTNFIFLFVLFSSISSISGGGSSMRRKILVISLLNSCREMEMKYLVRTLVSFPFKAVLSWSQFKKYSLKQTLEVKTYPLILWFCLGLAYQPHQISFFLTVAIAGPTGLLMEDWWLIW